ncbi:hypothetical protein [Tuwongella immobilis]|uniref:Uncharacterized protein n=1 Tax=Tuwongella immobilis TaxID=692036 RepID=A0A6C2YUQ4_9BACT|nr:hypothetical protein [Tuwongella immobilis]VIP05121.1 unnamed protein product [Tuwongella immobilis]VTS07598.1 unnamed protein product [Tuwongella immobilis]
MARFRRIFTFWFALVFVSFALANLTGVIRPRGLLPFRFTGFPFTFMTWGLGIEEYFDWQLLLLNCLIGCVGAVFIAGVLAWIRCKSVNDRKAAQAGSNITPEVK